jgi:hypothetical protein
MPDEAYHFPPDLIDLLIDTIPLLCRSKQDVLTFFRGCGVAQGTMTDLYQRVATDRTAISKVQIEFGPVQLLVKLTREWLVGREVRDL